MDLITYGLLNGKIEGGIGEAIADYMAEHASEIAAEIQLPYETWTFTLSDDTTVTKKVVITT